MLVSPGRGGQTLEAWAASVDTVSAERPAVVH